MQSIPTKEKLPKLSLKKFSRNPVFLQLFIIKNTSSQVDKFNYLKTLLDGPAVSAIAEFSLTKENYETALELLKDRCPNLQVIVSSHVDALLKLESVVKMKF